MRRYAMVLPEFWTGSTGKALKRLGVQTQLLALYFITCPNSNMIGLYYVPLATVEHETGLSHEGTAKALRSLREAGFAWYDEEAEAVWIPEMARFQIGEALSPKDNRVKGIINEAVKYRKCRYFREFVERYTDVFHLGENLRRLIIGEGASKPLPSQEQEQEQKQEQETHPASAGSTLTPLEKPITEFPCLSGKSKKPTQWPLTHAFVAELSEAYPGLDILQECRKAWVWLRAAPGRLKTHDGMREFLRRWIDRACNSNRGPIHAKPTNNFVNNPEHVVTVKDL